MTSAAPLTLDVLHETYCICRVDRDAGMPGWVLDALAKSSEFVSVTCGSDELSVVLPEGRCACDPKRLSDGWHCLRVRGPLDLSMTGVMLGLLQPLAGAGCAVFAVSTYDTDYLLVKDDDLPRALAALRAAGHVVHD